MTQRFVVSPSSLDITTAPEQLDLLQQVRMFRAETIGPTRPDDVVREAWDIDLLAASYAAFLERWQHGRYDRLDALSRQLLLWTQ